MTTESYHFKVGTFECLALSDGTFRYPASLFFANAPKDRYELALRKYGQSEEIVTPYICLLIDTGSHRVLVDTGAGSLAPSTGRLLRNLQAEGIEPGDIDTVILSHGHADHIGGNADDDGRPVFHNARYVMWREEWDFWSSGPSLTQLRIDPHLKELLLIFANKNLPPIRGQLELVDHESEVLPGVHALAAPGHTPGHMALAISSAGQQLLYAADTLLHPIHLEHAEWYPIVDLVPEQALSSRRRLFERAAADKALVLAFHFPFPGLGHVIFRDDAWQWQPLENRLS